MKSLSSMLLSVQWSFQGGTRGNGIPVVKMSSTLKFHFYAKSAVSAPSNISNSQHYLGVTVDIPIQLLDLGDKQTQ